MPVEPEITVAVLDPSWDRDLPDAPELCRRAAGRALAAAGRDFGAVEVSIALADDELVRSLNLRYRKKDAPTNVLSFPGAASNDTPRLLGDIVLARQTVVDEALAQHKSTAEHVTHLIVHGLLHLLGYDHDVEEEAAAMEELEIGVLASLGVSDPYLERSGSGADSR